MLRLHFRAYRPLFLPLFLLISCNLFLFFYFHPLRAPSAVEDVYEEIEGWRKLPVVKEQDGRRFRTEWQTTPMEDSFWFGGEEKGECAERWIARGDLCRELEPGQRAKREPKQEERLDILWTWINGSAPLLLSLRKSLLSSNESTKAYLEAPPRFSKPSTFGSEYHFREHGELKYSLRSVMPSLALYKGWGNLMVVSADFKMEGEERWGQVPVWFEDGNGLEVIHHSDLFSPSLKDAVPSFNSMAIESQFPFLPDLLSNRERSTKTILYMNDDFFFLSPLPPSFFFSPVSGPVFRVQPDLLVDGEHPSKATRRDKEGEWVGLKYANYILNDRFGTRKRPYLHHNAKVLSLPILQEIRNIWEDELLATGRSRFRGVDNEVTITFLAAHYTIEKHRESLLYAWFSKADVNRDGLLNAEEKREIRSLLLASGSFKEEEGDILQVFHPSNRVPSISSLEHEEDNLFTSVEGYPFFQPFLHLQAPKDVRRRNTLSKIVSRFPFPELVGEDEVVCEVNLRDCFGEEDEQAEDVFKRVAFERNKQCGDCILVALLRGGERKGLDSFLPLPSMEPRGRERIDSSTLQIGMTKSFSESSFPFPPTSSSESTRKFFLHLLARYSYSLFNSPLLFHIIRSPVDLERELARLLPDNSPDSKLPPLPYKMLTLNDDLKNGQNATFIKVEELMAEFFEGMWGEEKIVAKPPWEKEQAVTGE